MLQTDASCQLDVDRGPEWLFIRLRLASEDMSEPVQVAEPAWQVIDQHRIYRVVIELDQIVFLHSYLVGQLVLLQKRIHAHGGVLRLCGLTARNRDVLHLCRLESHLPSYANRGDAVMGHQPTIR